MNVTLPNNMYKMKPNLDDNFEVDLPSCMYKVKPIFNIVSDQTCQSDDATLLEIEEEQKLILERIQRLTEKVSNMKLEMDISAKAKPLSIQTIPKSPLKVSPLKIQLERGIPKDIVINVDPKNVPISVWLLYQTFSQSIKVGLHSLLHSTIMNAPSFAGEFNTLPSSVIRTQYDLILSIIWKAVPDYELVVDPLNSSTIKGEENVARYLARITNTYYENLGAETATEIDHLLESFNLNRASSKEQQSALRSLNAHIGRKPYLAGDNLTLADIVLWSQLIENKLNQSLPKNLDAWFKRLQQLEPFQSVPQVFLV